MTPALRAKIKRLVDDPNCDPMTRQIAQAQLDTHMVEAPPPPRNSQHPGLRQSEEYQAYAKRVKEANRVRKRR